MPIEPVIVVSVSAYSYVASSVSAQVPLEPKTSSASNTIFRCILCFSACASRTIPPAVEDSAVLSCILCFSASASETTSEVTMRDKYDVLHPLFHRKCLSNSFRASVLYLSDNVASSVSSQVPLKRHFLELLDAVNVSCILCFSAIASESQKPVGHWFYEDCCILCFSASPSEIIIFFPKWEISYLLHPLFHRKCI